MYRLRTHIAPLLAVAVLLLGASNARSLPGAQTRTIDTAPEKRAIFVDNQRKLWTWPPAAAPRAGAPFTIGILGNDPFQQGAVNHLDQRIAGQKNVVAVRFANINAIAPCHILVVSQAADLAPALEKTKGTSTLVIAQEKGLAEKGAMLSLPVVQNRFQIEINLIEAQKAGLTPNPGLVRMATEVIR